MPKAKSKEIVWEGDIYIDRVADLRNDLLNAFDKCEEIHLSLEKVTDFDVSGIQLIFASHKEALLRNKTFIVTGSINPTLEREFEVRYNDLDVNFHTNNGNYIIWAFEPLDFEFRNSHKIKTLDIVFKKETKYGEKIISQVQFLSENTTVPLKPAGIST